MSARSNAPSRPDRARPVMRCAWWTCALLRLLTLLAASGFSRTATAEPERKLLASGEVAGATVSLHGSSKSGWLHVRLDNPSPVRVHARFKAVLACPSKKTPEVTATGSITAAPRTSQASDGAVAGCPGFSVDAFSLTDVQFDADPSTVKVAGSTCESDLQNVRIGFEPKRGDVAWVKLRTSQRSVTLSRVTLLALHTVRAKRPTDPQEEALLLGGSIKGRPASVPFAVLLDKLCAGAPPAAELKTRAFVALRKGLAAAVELAEKATCDPDDEPCGKSIRSKLRTPTSEGVRN